MNSACAVPSEDSLCRTGRRHWLEQCREAVRRLEEPVRTNGRLQWMLQKAEVGLCHVQTQAPVVRGTHYWEKP